MATTTGDISIGSSRGSGKAPTGKAITRRLTADLPEDDAETLARVAESTGFNKVTTLVRAIRVLALLDDAEQQGAHFTIRYPDGQRERLIIR